MKKTAILCLLALVLGCSSGLLLNVKYLGGRGVLDSDSPSPAPKGEPFTPLSTAGPQQVPELEGNGPLLKAGGAVLAALKKGDIDALSSLIDPDRGITFTPYSTVTPHSDLTFLPDQLSQAGINGTRYVWGYTQGKGDPITLTLPEYLSAYVYNMDYASAPVIGVDRVLSSGNSLENVADAYPDARFIEYYFPSEDPANNGLDWCALKLVFQYTDDAYWLVGVIHSEWTI